MHATAARLIAYRAKHVTVDILDVPAILATLTPAEVAEMEESFCTVTGHYAMMYPNVSGHIGAPARPRPETLADMLTAAAYAIDAPAGNG